MVWNQIQRTVRLDARSFGWAAVTWVGVYLVFFALQYIPLLRDNLGHIPTVLNGIRAVEPSAPWRAAVWLISALIVGMFVAGILVAVRARALLGAGMSRRAIVGYVATQGALSMLLASALAALAWGFAAITGLPELSGVTAWQLILIALSYLGAFTFGAMIAALFVRLRWWVVVGGAIVLQVLAVFVPWLVNRIQTGSDIVELNLGDYPALATLWDIAAPFVFLAVIWVSYRSLPIRRS